MRHEDNRSRIDKLRDRANHPTTPPPEAEACRKKITELTSDGKHHRQSKRQYEYKSDAQTEFNRVVTEYMYKRRAYGIPENYVDQSQMRYDTQVAQDVAEQQQRYYRGPFARAEPIPEPIKVSHVVHTRERIEYLKQSSDGSYDTWLRKTTIEKEYSDGRVEVQTKMEPCEMPDTSYRKEGVK